MSLTLRIEACPPDYRTTGQPQVFSCTRGSIGRDPANDIVLPDPGRFVSGRHALIDSHGGVCTVTDISTNGTFLNQESEAIGVGNQVRLEHGDRLRIGDYVLGVEVDRTVISHEVAREATQRLRGITAGDATFRPRAPRDADRTRAEARAWRALLAAARLDAELEPDELLATELGRTIALVTQGIMENLKTRTDVKEEFGVPLTRIRHSENNPMKFAVSLNEALMHIFLRHDPGYTHGAGAYVESLDDFRIHEIATMAALRAAADSMISRFQPSQLKRELRSDRGGSGLIGAWRRELTWEQYEAWFNGIAADERLFERLFGRAFATAYDEKVQRLKAMRRGE